MTEWGAARWAGTVGRFMLLLFMVTVAVFLLLEMIPGDPVDALLPEGASPEQIAAANEQYGFDKPLAERYLDWLSGILHGDFGTSFQTGIPVWDSLVERAPVSFELAFWAILLALAIAIPVGVWSAYRPFGVVDRIATVVTSGLLATPSFVLGIVLVYVFAVSLKVFPTMGWVPFSEDPVAHFQALVLPVITLAASELVLFIRVLKSDMIATLQQDHVLSARARGLPTWHIITWHSLRQSSFSLVTVSGMVIGRLIGGTVLVEAIFSLPGIGTMVLTAINSRDYIVVQAVVLLSAVVYLLVNGLVDVAYPLLDPRVRKKVKTA